jgi:hypothetical protein
MSGKVEATIAGYNKFIEEQRELGPGRVTLVLFDDEYELVYEDTALAKVPELTGEVYYTRGWTALLDAMGKTISDVQERHLNDRPDKTLFLVITDGIENRSQEYTAEGQVKKMVRECIEDHGWEFFYLGANVDTFREAVDKMGFDPNYVSPMPSDRKGTQHAYATASAAMSMSRSGGGLSAKQTMSDLMDEQKKSKVEWAAEDEDDSTVKPQE